MTRSKTVALAVAAALVSEPGAAEAGAPALLPTQDPDSARTSKRTKPAPPKPPSPPALPKAKSQE